MSISVARFPSLATRWLQRLDKWLPQSVVVVAQTRYGGFYVRPQAGEYWICGRPIDARRGIICISESAKSEEEAETVAHEWRHHWQFWSGWQYDNLSWDALAPRGYEAAIISFFTGSRSEMDALRFSHERSPSPQTEQWCQMLRNRRKKKR